MTFPSGAYSTTLDKLDQGVDFIKEASHNAGYQFGVDVAVLVGIGVSHIYDEVISLEALRSYIANSHSIISGEGKIRNHEWSLEDHRRNDRTVL